MCNYSFHDKAKADCLNKFYASTSSVSDEQISLLPLQPNTDSKLSSIFIEENEIKDIIEILDRNKTTGPDFISKKMLKRIPYSVMKPLCILFNII